MSDLTLRKKTLGHVIWAIDYGGDYNKPVPPGAARPIHRLCGRTGGRVADSAHTYKAQVQLWHPMVPPPPPPPHTHTHRARTNTYQVLLLKVVGPMAFTLEGCQGQAEIRTGIQVHFVLHHIQDTVVIVEEGK